MKHITVWLVVCPIAFWSIHVPSFGAAGAVVDGGERARQRCTAVMVGSSRYVDTAIKDADVIVVAKFVKMESNQPAGLGASRCFGEVLPTRVLKGDKVGAVSLRFEVATFLGEAPPKAGRTYLFIIKSSVGAEKAEAIQVLPTSMEAEVRAACEAANPAGAAIKPAASQPTSRPSTVPAGESETSRTRSSPTSGGVISPASRSATNGTGFQFRLLQVVREC